MTDWGVVIVAGARFGGRPALGDWQLARALAAHRRVLYVDPPTFAHDAVRNGALRGFRLRLEQVAANIALLSPIATPGANRPFAAWLGDRAIGHQVRAASQHLGRHRVILIFDPKRGTLPSVERDALIYWRRDRLAESARARHPAHLARRDRRLVQQAALVTGVSQPLVDEAEAAGARTVLIPNGCDYDHFQNRQALPEPLRHLPQPIVGYAGGVSQRIDADLLVGLADSRPQWSFVVVGEVVTRIPLRSNLVVAGRVPYEDLPGWLQTFDVGIVPYRRDRFNLASSPLKVFEYLAAGCPVVSTSLPAVADLAPFVRVADEVDDFASAIEVALRDGPDRDACAEVAQRNTWNDRARLLQASVEEVLSAE